MTRALLVALVVILAASICAAQDPCLTGDWEDWSTQPTDENKEPAAVEKPTKRNWWEFQSTSGVGKDSNVLLAPDSPSDEFFSQTLGIDYRRTAFDHDPDKVWELGLLGSVTSVAQRDLNEASRLGGSIAGYVEGNVSSASLGLFLRTSELRIDGDAFSNDKRGMFAFAWAWGQSKRDECDRNRTLLYLARDDHEDRRGRGEPAFDRNVIGARHSFLFAGDDWVCLGGGLFREANLIEFRSLHLGSERREEEGKRTNFTRTVYVVDAEGRLPLGKTPTRRPALDWAIAYRWEDRASGVRPEDALSYDDGFSLDVGLLVSLRRQGAWEHEECGHKGRKYNDIFLRPGVSYAEQNSDVAQFHHDRLVYSLMLEINFGGRNDTPLRRGDVPNPGSQVDQDSGSGADQPRTAATSTRSQPGGN